MADRAEPGQDGVLDRLAETLPAMSPQVRKAARYVLDNPLEIGLRSVRDAADAAGVKPNTLVRMARLAGFDGYEDFRQPFRAALAGGRDSFPDRARWLQSIGRGGGHGGLLAQMAAAAVGNVEAAFETMSATEVTRAADRILAARVTYVLGVGINAALARLFAYLARMVTDRVVAVPRDGSLPVDDIARAQPGDVLLAMTYAPYRTEVIDTVRMARRLGLPVILITDSRGCPIASEADQLFVLPTDTPQMFNSVTAVTAFLETLMAFVVAGANPDAVQAIERFNDRRHQLGVYWTDDP